MVGSFLRGQSKRCRNLKIHIINIKTFYNASVTNTVHIGKRIDKKTNGTEEEIQKETDVCTFC